MIGRMDRPNRRFINSSLGVEQYFVQMKQRIVEILHRAPDRILIRWPPIKRFLRHNLYNSQFNRRLNHSEYPNQHLKRCID